MFAIVKTQFGWTVRNESNGRSMGTFTRLLDAAAMVERLNADPDFDSMVSGPSGFYVHP